MSLVAGLVGALGTIWQVYRFYREKRESATERLGKNVLYPWSKVELIYKHTRSQSPLMKTLQVPAEALPGKEAALAKHPYGSGTGWLELEELAGLPQGMDFLQAEYPEAWRKWQRIEKLLREYHELRSTMVGGVPIVLEEEMQRLFPELEQAPDGTHDPEPGTYILAHIATSVVRDAYYIALYQDETRGTRLKLVPTSRDDVVTYELRGDKPFLRVADEDRVNLEEMQASYDSWVQQAGLRTMASNFVNQEAELAKSLEEFGKRLQDVIDEIVYERRPRRRRRTDAS